MPILDYERDREHLREIWKALFRCNLRPNWSQYWQMHGPSEHVEQRVYVGWVHEEKALPTRVLARGCLKPVGKIEGLGWVAAIYPEGVYCVGDACNWDRKVHLIAPKREVDDEVLDRLIVEREDRFIETPVFDDGGEHWPYYYSPRGSQLNHTLDGDHFEAIRKALGERNLYPDWSYPWAMYGPDPHIEERVYVGYAYDTMNREATCICPEQPCPAHRYYRAMAIFPGEVYDVGHVWHWYREDRLDLWRSKRKKKKGKKKRKKGR